jgi:hypothetical protein
VKKFQLSNDLSFGIEPYERGIRLIVFNGKEEWVCRKETRSNVNKFLSGPDASLFKGRLQLIKQSGAIGIEVKGVVVGKISSTQLSQSINS